MRTSAPEPASMGQVADYDAAGCAPADGRMVPPPYVGGLPASAVAANTRTTKLFLFFDALAHSLSTYAAAASNSAPKCLRHRCSSVAMRQRQQQQQHAAGLMDAAAAGAGSTAG
jgi:hypothetical protein